MNAVSAAQKFGHGSRTFKFDAGAEPGIDVDKVELDLDAAAHVTVVDYSKDRYKINDDLDLEEAFEEIRKLDQHGASVVGSMCEGCRGRF